MLRPGVLFLAAVGALFAVACSAVAPAPEIVGIKGRDGIPNFDYTVYVDCTVRNNGRAGNVEVIADLTGGGQWRKRSTVAIAKGEERLVTIVFPEAELFGGGFEGFKYQCSARPI